MLYVLEARTFRDGGPPPPDPDPNAKKAGGAFRFDVKTGRVTAVKDYKPKDEDFPNSLYTKTKAGGWEFWVEQVPSNASMPGHLTSRVLKAERECASPNSVWANGARRV